MSTLKISELSVGDWVKCDQRNGRIQRIAMHDGETVEVIIEAACGRLYMYKMVYEIDSIPITPEILEESGIHKTYECDEYAVYRGEEFSITEYYTDLWEFESRRNRVTIKRVHQFQHALRLAGVEKEIVIANK